MINVAVQQGTPSSAAESNGSFNYGLPPSLSARLRHSGRQQNGNQNSALSKAKEVYRTVVVPTIFPGHPPPSPINQTAQSQQRQISAGVFYQPQCCIVGANNNNNCKQHPYQQLTSVTTGTVYQQWSTSPMVGYSFMQQQLHQYRQQQLPQRVPVPAPNDRSYVYHGLKRLSSSGVGSVPIGLRSPILQGQRTANVRVYESSSVMNPMAAHSQQATSSPSPKRVSSRRHHHGHHHYHFGQTSGGAYDLLESDALQRRHRFPTNFCRTLHEYPPPVPPILLRAMPAVSASNGNKATPASAVPRYKDPANRLKVMLRVLSSASSAADGGAGSPEASFLVVDSRKKQITLMEQAQTPQRQPLSSQPLSGVSTAMVPKIFGFDAAFSPDDSQTEICSTTLTEVVQTVVNEGDGCVLVFGSADQGKSHTAIGSDASAQTLGILPCAVSWLYRAINEIRQRTGARFSIRVSAVEVAGPQEDLRDLLADLTSVASNGADSSNPYEACLREDPVFGTQLHNVSELRAPTPDKAAFYLDAALAKRRSGSEEERRNSHLFYTLHIYQYRVNEKQQRVSDEAGVDPAGVAGGRTRLHLIDLGAGEKNSKPGRASLTLPALGNVLLTLLQGQKHLPFKESKVTQILKSCIGSGSCKAVSVVACASGDPERRMETVNVVQIAGRLYRIRRTKRGSAKFGFGAGNSSGGESSNDDRSGRRRFPRSASDPDCTTSSSEQSCDTVIYLGAGGARSRTGSAVGGVPTSVAISDQEIPPPFDESDPGGSNAAPTSPKRSGGASTAKENSNSKKAHTPGRQSTGGHKQMPFVPPAMIAGASNAKSCEQWIDGPKASKQPKLVLGPMETAADNAAHNIKLFSHPGYASGMDPFKREMIRQWVVHQERERAAFGSGAGEVWIDRSPKAAADLVPIGNFEGTGARPKQFSGFGHQHQPPPMPEGQEDRGSVHSVSMETSSSARSSSSCSDMIVLETRDVALQCCEEEIDIDCGRYNIPLSLLNDGEVAVIDHSYPFQHNNNTINQEYAAVATWAEPEMRMLEDIAEVEEEEITTSAASDGTPMMASRHSSLLRAAILVTAASGSPPYRNEAMAPRPATADGAVSVLLTAPSTSSLHSLTRDADFNDDDEHPLRILSKERVGGSRSDTFSLDNDDATDAFSLPTSEMFAFLGGPHSAPASGVRGKLSADEDSSSLTDEDLERAMQASLTSIRSHEILEKLKSEGRLRRMNEGEDEDDENSAKDGEDLSENGPSRKASFGRPARPEPEGLNDEETEKASQKRSIVVDQKSTTQSSKPLISDKLTKPTVPQLSKPVANLVTSQLISGLTNSPVHKSETPAVNRNVAQKQQRQVLSGKQQLAAPPAVSVCTSEEQGNEQASARMPSPQPHSSLPRPSKLPSPRCQDRTSSQPQGPTTKTPSTKQQKDATKAQVKSDKDKTKAIAKPASAIAAKGVTAPSTPPAPTGTPVTSSVPATVGERSKAKPASSSSVLKSPIMSFLKSPSKFKKPSPTVSTPPAAVAGAKGAPTNPSQPSTAPSAGSTLTPPAATIATAKRASSGYDSGHDSGIVTVDSPDLLLASPYSKVTKPRASQRSSSGHGSDNSSAVSSDAGGASAALSGGKLGRACVTKLASVTKKASPIISGKATIRRALTADRDASGGCASSSGYESATSRARSKAADELKGVAAATTSPESGSDVDQGLWASSSAQDRLRSPPSVKLHRKKWLDGFGFDASKSRSAPQSPSGSVTCPPSSSRLRILQSQYATETSLDGQQTLKGVDLKQQRISAVENLKVRQRELKRELKQAKERLGVPPSKWSYDLHVSDCMDTTNPNMLEALHQETRILEKRVAACKSHILMVTVFDAVPAVPQSPNTAKKCS